MVCTSLPGSGYVNACYTCPARCSYISLDTAFFDGSTSRCIIEKTPTLNVHVQSVLKDIVIPETVIHGTVPSHEGVQEGCSSNPMPSLTDIHGYQYLKSLFYGDRFAGSTNHALDSGESGIYDLLKAHGMSIYIYCDLSLHANRAKLLQHIIHGDCKRDPEDDAHQ